MDITDKIDAVTKIGEDRIALGGIQKPPKSVKIELTAKCNLRCKFCALRTRERQPKSNMDINLFMGITADMRMAGVEEIGLFYLGEPFMAPDLLIEATRWCKDLGFPWVFVTSNATIAYPHVVDKLMEAGLDSLKWSVNYGSFEQFHDITGGSLKMFEQARDNIVSAYEIREAKGYKTILSASSILYGDDQKDFIALYIMRNINAFVDKHYWLPMYQMGMYKDSIEKELGYTPTIGNMGRLDDDTLTPNRKPLPCWATFTEGHVRVDGGLSACCFGADSRFDMGQLDGTNFMSQWNSAPFQALRRAQLKTIDQGPKALKGTPCKVCVAYEG